MLIKPGCEYETNLWRHALLENAFLITYALEMLSNREVKELKTLSVKVLSVENIHLNESINDLQQVTAPPADSLELRRHRPCHLPSKPFCPICSSELSDTRLSPLTRCIVGNL